MGIAIDGQALDWGLAIRRVPLSEEQQHRCGSRWPCHRVRLHKCGAWLMHPAILLLCIDACLGRMVKQRQRVAVVLQAMRAEEEQGGGRRSARAMACPLLLLACQQLLTSN